MKRIITLLQILFLCIFVVCAGVFAKLYYDKLQTEKEMEGLQALVEEPAAEKKDESYEEPREGTGMLSKYYELYNKNHDMAGWVKIDGTNIDYPVLHHEGSNAYYLHRGFNGEKNSAGMIFMDYQCNRDGKSTNTIVYGHNMRGGTMFHSLLSYQKKEFWAEHKYIGFDTMFNTGRYEIFAVFRTAVGSKNEFKYYEFVDAESKAEYDEFIAACKAHSIYDTGITPIYGEKLLTLSTCSYNSSNERFVVVAVKRR